MNQGKIIIAVFLLLGILGGLGGYWWNYWISHRAMEFWGPENAQLIRLAPKVELMRVGPPSAQPSAGVDNEQLKTMFGTLTVSEKYDLSQARGLIHLRNAFLSDDQFRWDKGRYNSIKLVYPPSYCLRFRDASGNSLIIEIIEMNKDYVVARANGHQHVVLGPLAPSLERFLARELPRAKPAVATEKSPVKSE